MTEKENLMRMLRGDMPEWLPFDDLGFHVEGATSCVSRVRPTVYSRKDGKDIFGVEYTGTDSAGGFSLPTPNKFLLKDIHDWKNVIKAPDINDFDFEEMARKELAKIDRSKTAVHLGSHGGYFQALMAFMGFSEGLFTLACYPDEVYDLFEYMQTSMTKSQSVPSTPTAPTCSASPTTWLPPRTPSCLTRCTEIWSCPSRCVLQSTQTSWVSRSICTAAASAKSSSTTGAASA